MKIPLPYEHTEQVRSFHTGRGSVGTSAQFSNTSVVVRKRLEALSLPYGNDKGEVAPGEGSFCIRNKFFQ